MAASPACREPMLQPQYGICLIESSDAHVITSRRIKYSVRWSSFQETDTTETAGAHTTGVRHAKRFPNTTRHLLPHLPSVRILKMCQTPTVSPVEPGGIPNWIWIPTSVPCMQHCFLKRASLFGNAHASGCLMQDSPLRNLPGTSAGTFGNVGRGSRPQAARLRTSIPAGTRDIEPSRNGGNS